MKRITSAQNPTIKQVRLLSRQAKARQQAGQTLLEGIHLGHTYLNHGGKPQLVLVEDSQIQSPEVKEILHRSQEAGAECIEIPSSISQSISTVEHGIGLYTVIEIPPTPKASRLTSSALLLDDVQDPGNVGTMMRTAAAAGIKHIYCSPGTASAWAPKVLRAGMGAHFTLNIHTDVDLASLISDSDIPIYATSSYATQSIYDLNLHKSAAWMMGNEGQGVSEQLMKLAIIPVLIPQEPEVESLNVAAATAVCLFEHRRQLLES